MSLTSTTANMMKFYGLWVFQIYTS